MEMAKLKGESVALAVTVRYDLVLADGGMRYAFPPYRPAHQQ